MAVNVKVTDNSKIVLQMIDRNGEAALEAMGIAAVGMIVKQMQSGYGKPIRQTGDLMRDVQHEVNASGKYVRVGNTLFYGPFVHGGTLRMPGRPYVRDGLSGKEKQLGAIASEQLKKGF